MFITGTNTNIGKTLISSWICIKAGLPYLKPIQTGCETDDDSAFVKLHTKAQVLSPVYKLKAPLSPYAAAKLENIEIDVNKLLRAISSNIVIEGAGGIMVPITKNYFFADFIADTKLPTVIVASTELGTINHTLLTVQKLRDMSVHVLGIVLNGKPDKLLKEIIEECSGVRVIKEFPVLKNITYDELYNTECNIEF